MAPPRSARSVICQDPRRAITVSLDLSPLQQRIASHAASAQRVDAPRHGAPALRETPRLTACERVLAAELQARGDSHDALAMMVASMARMVQAGRTSDSRWKAS